MEHAEVERLVMKPTARRRLGKYVLLGRLGHGGMGKIYLAYAPGPAGIEKLLVVKRLHSHLTSDPVLVNSFLDEARLSMALNHPHIVSTFDVGEVDGRYFMVMEYIDGQNLGVVLRTAKRTGHYPASSLWAGLFLDVLDGLHAAHTARDARGRPLHIIHRDVSPQNILITYEGVPKLVDFGIAKAAQRVSETDAGVLKGKYAYMSPEQVRGEPLDPRSDVFAAGIVLWEMLAGRRLYKADTIVRSVERILTEAPISPVRVNAECNPEIAQVAFRALQKDREQRFASAAAFKEALEDAIRRSGAHVRRADTRELMQQLFHDVIEKQRAVLEACLAAGDAQPVIGDDEEEPAVSSRPGADSESDVSLQNGRREEATTPSAARNSPLVTGDNEGDRDRAQTRLQRRKSRTGGDAGLIADDAARAVEPPPGSASSPATASMAPGRHAQAAAFSAIEATATQPTNPGRPRRVWPWAVAALLVAGIGGGLGVAYARARAPGQDHTFVADFGPPPPVLPAPQPSTPTPMPPTPLPPTLAEPTPVEPTPVEPTPVEPTPAVDAGAAEAAGDAGAAAAEPAKEPVKPHVTPREPKRPPRPIDRPPPRERETAAVDKPPEEAPTGATGTLSLETVPWTTVYLGGKKLGETPLVNVPVPAGNLELLLVNTEAGIKESYQTKVKAGAATKVRLDLN